MLDVINHYLNVEALLPHAYGNGRNGKRGHPTVGEDVGSRNSHTLIMGLENGTPSLENSSAVS